MVTKPICLDLFCKAGGTSRGYQQAGFYVVGVDIEPQKNYIGDDFLQADALEVLRILVGGGCIVGQSGRAYYLADFDLIAASPPCQAYTMMGNAWKGREYPDLVAATRAGLIESGLPYVIENVVGAPLLNPILLCGSMFGLKVYRHRLFECNPWLLMPPHVIHRDSTPKAGRGPSPKGFWSIAGRGGGYGTKEGWSMAMDINWMTLVELSQAIPPAYTKWIGQQMLNLISKQASALALEA